MFGIGLLTLIDACGWLVRGVGAALLLATFLAWVPHLVRRQRAQKDASAAAADVPIQAPAVLLAITSFFLVGIVLAEAYRAQQQRASVAAAVMNAPAAGGASAENRAPAAAEAAPAPTPPQTAESRPAEPVQLAAPSSITVPAAQVEPEPAPAVATLTPVPPRKPPPGVTAAAPAAAPRATKATPLPSPSERKPATAAPVLTAQQSARCTELLSRFSLGESLQTQDQQFLRTTCH